ncbi:hypothetical protein ACEN9F_13515 [Duganella sp. CT11-25]|uniref:hypothetical protein n=1 Tax=unclassified Duganella TaxID=2636909 RepID=UPI0039AF91E9
MRLFRQVHLPYVIQSLDDGRHIVLNRLYKPLGIDTNEHLDYATEPSAMKIHGLTAAKARSLAHDGDADIEQIYLYDDGCTPDSSPANWAAYSKRLQILCKLKVGAKP